MPRPRFPLLLRHTIALHMHVVCLSVCSVLYGLRPMCAPFKFIRFYFAQFHRSFPREVGAYHHTRRAQYICRSLSVNSVYVSVARAHTLSLSQTLSLITMQTQIRRIRADEKYTCVLRGRNGSVMILWA